MRFTVKRKEYPTVGDERTITKFALVPIKIREEIRWLEKVRIFQRCETWTDASEMGVDTVYGWRNKKFV